VACPAHRTECSSAYFLVPSAHQWLVRLVGQIARWRTSSFLPLVSGLPGSPNRALIGLLPRSFHSSVACLARRTERSSAYFLVSSTHQWLARLAGQIAHRLTSSFLPLVSGLPGSPDRSLIGLLPRSFRSSVTYPARRTDHSSAYFLVSSVHQWLARLAGRIAHRLTFSFLLLISGLPSSPDGALISLLARFFRSSVACPSHRTDRSSAYFLVPSAHQWLSRLAGRIAHRLTSSFLPLISCLPDGCSGGSLVGLLPRFFRSSAAHPTVPQTDRSSAYFLVSSTCQWLAGRIARWLTSSSFRSSVACPARRTERSSAYFPVSSARQWLARLAGRITSRLTSSFLPLISGLPGSLNGALIGLLPRFFRSSVACLARRTERSSAYFPVSSARQWLARLARQIAHWLTSSFLPLISDLPSSPDGSLIGLLPRFFRSSVACPARRTDRSSTHFLVSSAHQWLAQLARWSAHQLTCSFLPLVSGLPISPDRSLISLLPRSFRSSVAFPARRTDRSWAYFLISSAHQWLARRFLGWIARRLTASILPLVGGSPDGSSDRSLIGLLPRFFRSLVACAARRTDRSWAYFLVPSARPWLAPLAGRITHRLTSSFLPLVSGLPHSPDGSHIDLLPRSFRSSVACPARRTDRSSAYFLVSSACRWLAGRIAHRLTSSFLPLISCLPDGSSGRSLVGLLPRFFRSSVARPTVPQTDRSSAYFLVSSTCQWLAGRITRRLTSSSFRSSVACPAHRTERSSAYFPVSSARQWLARLAGRITSRLTSSFLLLISGLPGSPDGLLIDLLPRSFRSSVA